jgi:hypothetical protein
LVVPVPYPILGFGGDRRGHNGQTDLRHDLGSTGLQFGLQCDVVPRGFREDRPRTLVQLEPIGTAAIRAANAVGERGPLPRAGLSNSFLRD